MRVRTFLAVAGVATLLAGSPVEAQLAMAGEAGVVMGQVGIIASDLDAQRVLGRARRDACTERPPSDDQVPRRLRNAEAGGADGRDGWIYDQPHRVQRSADV